MPTRISVDLAIVRAKPPLTALADVKLTWVDGEITIRRCAVFEKAGAPPWATLPRLPVDRNGKKQFVSLLDLPRDLKQRVLDAKYLSSIGTKAMRADTSFPGVSEYKSGLCRWGLTTRDGVRHETPGALSAGTGRVHALGVFYGFAGDDTDNLNSEWKTCPHCGAELIRLPGTTRIEKLIMEGRTFVGFRHPERKREWVN